MTKEEFITELRQWRDRSYTKAVRQQGISATIADSVNLHIEMSGELVSIQNTAIAELFGRLERLERRQQYDI